MPDPLVTLEGVSKEYGTGGSMVHALRGVSLSLPPGVLCVVHGRSGSGKTTLLNMIGGLDQPTSGQVVVGGRDLTRASSRDLARWRAQHVGFVFQFYNLLPVLTAARNIELPLLLTSLSRAERKKHVDAALELVGLADRADHYPSQLSGGQEQRVGIARAIINDPSLLLCDEPTGDLDRQTAGEILDLLAALNRRHGKTVIMVTHDPLAAARASRVLHVDKGVLVEAA